MVDEDPHEFIEEVYNIVLDMALSPCEKAELATSQLKDVAQSWFIQWRNNRTLTGGPYT